MNMQSILERLHASVLGDWMRGTAAAPVIESMHVVSAVLLFGTVLVVDLRLLGLADRHRTFTRISRETLPLTWIAFGVSAITGSLIFASNPLVYFANTAFRLKALALCAAGLNMAVFQLVTARGLAAWDDGRVPRAARMAGLLSVILWVSVVLLGRWIGFTKGYDFTVPPGVDLGF